MLNKNDILYLLQYNIVKFDKTKIDRIKKYLNDDNF